MSKTKTMNTYVKFGLIILACFILGTAIGLFSIAQENTLITFSEGLSKALQIIAGSFWWILIIFLAVEVLTCEICLNKIKKLGKQMKTANDEESDAIEYAIEKISAVTNIVITAITALSFLLLALTFSTDFYFSSGVIVSVGIFLFVVIFIYNGFWSVRFVKCQQKIYPEKQGDPASFKFTEQWVESCDEAEKELIYQSAFKSYLLLSKTLPLLIAAAMMMHLIWNTGIVAILFICVIWLMLNVSYLRNCVKKKGQKLVK